MESYKTRGVCAYEIQFDVDSAGIITFVRFVGGCPGNAAGVAKLAQGMHINEVIKRLRGIPCRPMTSCPDQLARALEEYKIKNNM